MLHERVEETKILQAQLAATEQKVKVLLGENTQVQLDCKAKEEALQVAKTSIDALSTRVEVIEAEVKRSGEKKAEFDALAQRHLEELNKIMLEKKSIEAELKEAKNMLEPS